MVNVGAIISYEALMWTKQLSAEVGNFFVIAVGNFMIDENIAATDDTMSFISDLL